MRKRLLGEGRSMAVSLALRRIEGQPRYDSEFQRFLIVGVDVFCLSVYIVLQT